MLRRGFPLIIAALAFAFALAIPARAQFGGIEGQVTDENGKPLVGAQIVIDRMDIKGTYKVKTDKKGHYFHGGLPLGQYKVTLSQGEQVMDFAQGIRVRMGDPQVVNFDMKAARERQMAAQAGIQVQAGGLSADQKAKIEAEMKRRKEASEKQEKLSKSFSAGMDALKQAQANPNAPAEQRAQLYDTAVTSLQQAAEADPNQHVVFGQLAEALVGRGKAAKNSEEAKGFYDKALDSYQKAIALRPEDASYHNNFALALVAAGRVPDAQAELQKAAEIDPPNAGRYYFNLGAVLTNAGKGKDATEVFKKAVAADPAYADAWYQLGLSLLGEATLDQSTGKTTPVPGTVEALQKYLELQPSGPHAGEAQAMIQTLSGTVTTKIGTDRPAEKAPAAKGRKR